MNEPQPTNLPSAANAESEAVRSSDLLVPAVEVQSGDSSADSGTGGGAGGEVAMLKAELERNDHNLAAHHRDYADLTIKNARLAYENDRLQDQVNELEAEKRTRESEWAGELHRCEAKWDEERDALRARVAELEKWEILRTACPPQV